MPYINRDPQNRIIEVFANSQYAGQEYLQNAEVYINPNIEILRQLDEIDKRSIRALRAGETDRIEALEAQAEELRSQLI